MHCTLQYFEVPVIMARRRSFRPKHVVIFINKKIVVFDGNLMIYFNTLYHYSAPLQRRLKQNELYMAIMRRTAQQTEVVNQKTADKFRVQKEYTITWSV